MQSERSKHSTDSFDPLKRVLYESIQQIVWAGFWNVLSQRSLMLRFFFFCCEANRFFNCTRVMSTSRTSFSFSFLLMSFCALRKWYSFEPVQSHPCLHLKWDGCYTTWIGLQRLLKAVLSRCSCEAVYATIGPFTVDAKKTKYTKVVLYSGERGECLCVVWPRCGQESLRHPPT